CIARAIGYVGDSVTVINTQNPRRSKLAVTNIPLQAIRLACEQTDSGGTEHWIVALIVSCPVYVVCAHERSRWADDNRNKTSLERQKTGAGHRSRTFRRCRPSNTIDLRINISLFNERQ